MSTSIFLEWANLLDLLEAKNPYAFNFFYHFHSRFGLKERDRYPSERLWDILDVSGDDYQCLLDEFTIAAIPDLSEQQFDNLEHEITNEGITFFF
jgi:hypothetical protein